MPQKQTDKKEIRFTKEQISESKRFRSKVDLVNTILEDGQQYTISETEKKIEEFLKGKVK